VKRSAISIDGYAQSNLGVLLKRADNPEDKMQNESKKVS